MDAGLRVGRPYEADILLETTQRISEHINNCFHEVIGDIVQYIDSKIG